MYPFLLLLNYIFFRVIISIYPVEWENYSLIKQVADYAKVILPIIASLLATIHGAVFLMEEYIRSQAVPLNESIESEEEERA